MAAVCAVATTLSTWPRSAASRLFAARRHRADFVGEARPQLAREVVTHALEADELRTRDRLRDRLATGDVDQRIVQPMHDDRRHLDVAQVLGAVRLADA